MPISSEPLIVEVQEQAVQVTLDQAQAAFVDLYMLEKVESLSGLDPWIERLASALSPERRQMNHVVINGLYFALLPTRPYASFPDYIDDLAMQPPESWIERMMDAYDRLEPAYGSGDDPARPALLSDVDLYLTYLRRRFSEEMIDEDVERQVHAWMGAPRFMQEVVIDHLRTMWAEHLAAAWQRNLSLLEECLSAFGQANWPTGSNVDIVRWVTGQELHAWHEAEVNAASSIRLVPSAHVGPYLGIIPGGETVWIVFGARLPEGTTAGRSALSRSDLLIRLNALADENRLHILELLVEHDELCAQDLIERLDLSQSSASRHLRQLSASGYVLERRQESAKCYRLNLEQVESTLGALDRFFGLASPVALKEPAAVG
jgi:DNA-binding transcriptional ArsR family regulator